MSDASVTPWLQSVELAGKGVRYSGHRLRYHPVVHDSRLTLRLVLPPAAAQQLVLEHTISDALLDSEIVAVEQGKVEWPVQLLRGWNRVRCSVPGEPGKVFVLDVIHKTGRREWLETLLYALTFALLIRTFLLQAFVLPIDSKMEQLLAGDRILVNRFHYRWARPARGDVAVLEYAGGESAFPGATRFVIKRVAAVAGDTVEVKAPDILVDGKVLTGPFASIRASGLTTSEMPEDVAATKVPPGSVFLVSCSKEPGGKTTVWWKFMTERSVVGRAFAVIWPWSRRGWLD